jgi:hypothetical protein
MSRPTLKPMLFPAVVAAIGALAATVWAQSETRISGVVRDLNTHRDITNVNIFLKGTKQGR